MEFPFTISLLYINYTFNNIYQILMQQGCLARKLRIWLRWGSRPFLSNDPLCFSCIHSFINALIHSLHLSVSRLNLVWPPPPLSRLGGVLWGRLLPPSLPSPLPFPGRGTRDLKGLSTEVPPLFPHSPRWQPPRDGGTLLPLDHPTHPPPCVFHCLLLLWFSVLPVRPACMHAPQCLCFSSALRNYLLPACSPKQGLLLWLLAPSQVVVVVVTTLLCCAAVSNERWKASVLARRSPDKQTAPFTPGLLCIY